MKEPGKLFFPALAVLILATVLVGFARTYFLAGVFQALLPSGIIHLHGAAFSLWVLLFMVQTSFVFAGRVDLHRRLGLLGFCLASLMVLLGLMAAIDALIRESGPAGPGPGARAFFAVPVSDMLLFAGMVYCGFRQRFNPAAHKRFMLLATITLLDAAFVRWPVPVAWWILQAAEICCYVLVILLVGYDLRSTGRVHRATLWTSVVLITVHQIRLPIGGTAPWQAFAGWIQKLAAH